MAVAPDPLLNLEHSLTHLSLGSHHPRSSSSPAMIPVLTCNNLSSSKPSPSLSGPSPTPYIPYADGSVPDFPPDAVPDRDSIFLASRSRVLRFYNLPPLPSVFLHKLFLATAQEKKSLVPAPKSLWTRRPQFVGIGPRDGIWAVFGTHEEACSALALLNVTVSVSPALETDLEPLHSLQRIQLRPTGPSMAHEAPIPANDLSPCDSISRQKGYLSPSRSMLRHSPESIVQNHSTPAFTLSSNPPNPRNVFRLGDWMCPSSNCAAHNFGRNCSCIGCGCPRPSTLYFSTAPRTSFRTINPAQVPSPRFVGALVPQMPASLSHRIPHILTPSGRAFSVGGRVQDVSSDPLFSCFMFWPDNEPLPEQGQIRPSNLVGVPHPPILNTGNRGPIEHQPGDWVCEKCNYLNWRRRKVCQTCYPYAEGNGDSIPAAVQADRIKRLREALTVTLPPTLPSLQTAAIDSPPQSSPVHIQHPHDCYLDSCRCRTLHSSALGSRDGTHCSVELGSRYQDTIYQTSTPLVLPSYREREPATFPSDNESGRLLPSCLQDIVQSPSLSPTSTASADLSVDEYIASPVSVYSTGSAKLYTNGDRPLHVHRTPSSVSLGLGNIWQLDGEESKALSSSLSPQNEISRV